MTVPTTRTLYLQPGFLCLPAKPTHLCAVVASGVAVTIFDREKGFGGMGHYSHPCRRNGESTPRFAAPALAGLVGLFAAAGSSIGDLETFIYGGSDNPEMFGFDPNRGMHNLRSGFEILEKLGLRVSGSDIGGRFARKLMFYTATGESMVAKVTEIRPEDWYPNP